MVGKGEREVSPEYAGEIHVVECLGAIQDVTGSNPVSRSNRR